MGGPQSGSRDRRVLVVAFDAMDRDLALTLVADGEMPNLAAALEEGRRADVRNPLGFVVGGVWPSYNTALGPGSHGRHCYVQLTPGTYDVETVTPYGIDGRPWWLALGDAGIRWCNVDVPFTVPHPDPNGFQVIDWGSHDRRIPFVTEPADLAPGILATYGPHGVAPRCDDLVAAGEWPRLVAALREGVATRTDMVVDLAARRDAHLVQVVYGESHCAGHQFWAVHDPSDGRHDPAMRAVLGDPLVALYGALDTELGRLRDAFDGHLTLVLLSHGMAAHHDGDHLLTEVLDRLDAARDGSMVAAGLRRSAGSAKALLRPLVPRSVLGRWYRAPVRVSYKQNAAVRVRRHARFFHHFNNTVYSGIRFNLVGREPEGRVDEAERDELTDWLTEQLEAITATATGEPVVDRVIRVSEHHHGRHRDALPDLLVDWNRVAPIEDVSSATIGRVRVPYVGPRTGDHRPDGLLVATGPGADAIDLSGGLDNVDIGPTVAALFGVDLDGVEGVSRLSTR